MHIFIVNLKRCPEKKQYMLEQLNRLNLTAEFIEAVDGQEISQETLDSLVYDFKNSYLTKNEVGCALSHINIYHKIIEQKIDCALILEDDAILPSNLDQLLTQIHHKINHKSTTVIHCGAVERLSVFKTHNTYDNIREYTAITGFGTHAYIINYKAAESLYRNLLPIKYEADFFRYFQENHWIRNFHALFPPIISTQDENKNNSSIQSERAKLALQRRHYFKTNILKKRSKLILLHSRLRKILLRPYTKKIKSLS